MDFDKKYFAAASILVIGIIGIGFAAFSASDQVEGPQTTYGYLPVSADNGLFDLPALMVAGPSYGNDYPDQYRCWDDSFYIDQDGDRDVEYFDGEDFDLSPGEYYTGYEKSYADAEICGGRYDYRCDFSSGCEGFNYIDDPDEEDDSGDDSSGGDDSGNENEPPEIDSVSSPAEVNVSEEFSINVDASDSDDPSLSYSWSNGESGQSIVLSYSEPGVKELDVEVSDGEDSVGSTVRVNVVEAEEENPEEPITDPEPQGLWDRLVDWYFSLF